MVEHREILDKNKYPFYDYVNNKNIAVAEFHAFIIAVGKPKLNVRSDIKSMKDVYIILQINTYTITYM